MAQDEERSSWKENRSIHPDFTSKTRNGIVLVMDQQPDTLSLIFVSLHILSLIMIGVVLIQWRHRAARGFHLGDMVPPRDWNSKKVGELIVVLLLIELQTNLIALALRKSGFLKSDEHLAFFTIVSQIILYAFLFLLVYKLLKEHQTSWKEAFGLKLKGVFRVILTGICALAAVVIPVALAAALSQSILEKLHYPVNQQAIFDLLIRLKSPYLKGGLIFLAIVGAPITEEILFRGIIYGWFKKNVGFTSAVGLNSLIFAVVHFHVPSILPLFVLAIAFTLVYEWTGNLATNIFMHASFNTASLLLFLLKTNTIPPHATG
jgi:membrane protease YdiL (CAAX protease family)